MKRFVLADCNNFFVSCERVFNPKLVGKPVVVLSSNDACVIARSNEAKKLGIAMGQPAYQCKDIFRKHKVIVYSANFALYGDMSSRIMQTLTEYSTDIEVYSVDEAFLHFPGLLKEYTTIDQEREYYTKYAHFVKQKVRQKIGIPISIGLGPTKTLAKIANHIAKKNSEYNGVFDITQHPDSDAILQKIDVSDIWGIGYRYAKLLYNHNIKNAYQLTNCSDTWIRKQLTINGLKTALELRGQSCLDLQDVPDPKKSITVSRMFGKNVTELQELKEGIAYHCSIAAEKLRSQQVIAGVVTVFVCFTNYYDSQRFYNSHTIQLPIPTAYTPTIIASAHACLEKLFKKGLIYKKVGIILDDFYAANFIQMNTFCALPDVPKQTEIMKTVDTINRKLGKNKVFFAAIGINQKWHTKRVFKSPAYTTNWNELLTIKI